jgi:hypothetical protein
MKAHVEGARNLSIGWLWVLVLKWHRSSTFSITRHKRRIQNLKVVVYNEDYRKPTHRKPASYNSYPNDTTCHGMTVFLFATHRRQRSASMGPMTLDVTHSTTIKSKQGNWNQTERELAFSWALGYLSCQYGVS